MPITVHHLFADDASIIVLLRDLARSYQARSAGLPSPLSPLPVQFADYVCWLEQWLESAGMRRQEAYWRQRLSAPRPRLEIPSSRPRGGTAAFRFRRLRRRIADTADQQLRQLARRHGVSLFTAVLAAYKLFLARRTNVQDIAVATMVSTRDGGDLREVIGPLLTTQILRTDLSGDPAFAELLARVQRTTVEALVNRDLPIDRVMAAVAGEDNPSERPYVTTLILFQQVSDEVWTMGDLQASPLLGEPGVGDALEITSYEMICEIETRDRSLDVIFRYDADLFDDDLARQMLDEFEGVLTSCANDQREPPTPRDLLPDGV